MAGMLARIFRGRGEVRDFSAGMSLGFSAIPGGPFLTPYLAENLSTVASCINVISCGLASLPVVLYQRTSNGRSEAPNHRLAGLFRTPNTHQSWPSFLQWFVAEALLRGNALAVIERDQSGWPTGLIPVPWQHVSVMLLPNAKLIFDVVAYEGPWFGGTGMPRRFLQDECLHLKDRGNDAYLGVSRLARSAGVVTNALNLQQFTSEFWREGAAPSGVLQHPKTLSDPARTRLKREFDARGGTTRRTLVLEEGLAFTPLAIAPETAEVLGTRRFEVAELARLFGVPPQILGDVGAHPTAQNAQEAARQFATFALAPWAKLVEAEFSRSVLPPGVEVEIDLSGLTRADPDTRWQSNAIAISNGILTVNEVRQAEGFDPVAGGDVLRMHPGAPMPTPAPAKPAVPAE